MRGVGEPAVDVGGDGPHDGVARADGVGDVDLRCRSGNVPARRERRRPSATFGQHDRAPGLHGDLGAGAVDVEVGVVVKPGEIGIGDLQHRHVRQPRAEALPVQARIRDDRRADVGVQGDDAAAIGLAEQDGLVDARARLENQRTRAQAHHVGVDGAGIGDQAVGRTRPVEVVGGRTVGAELRHRQRRRLLAELHLGDVDAGFGQPRQPGAPVGVGGQPRQEPHVRALPAGRDGHVERAAAQVRAQIGPGRARRSRSRHGHQVDQHFSANDDHGPTLGKVGP